MRKQDALAISACAAIVVTAALYVAEPVALIYYPVEHTWSRVKIPGIAMFWYGRSIVALGAGALTLAIGRPLLGRLASKWDAGAPAWLPKLLSAVTLAVLVGTLGHTVLHEYWTWMRPR